MPKYVSDDERCPITLKTIDELNETLFRPSCCQEKGKFVDLPALIESLKVLSYDRCPCCQQEGIRHQVRTRGYQIPEATLVNNFYHYIQSGDIDRVRQAISAGCDVNRLSEVSSPFLTQASSGQYFIIRPESVVSPLITAILSRQYDVFDLLLKQPTIMPNQADGRGNTALLAAAEAAGLSKDLRFLERVLQHPDIHINQSNREGATALATLAQFGCEPGVRLLLSRFPDTLLLNAEGEQDTTTALFYACQFGFESIVSLLLAHPRIDVNQVSSDGVSPLSIAISRHHYAVAFQLLAHPNILVNHIASGSGNTALILAADRLHLALVDALLRRGANPLIAASDGSTAISIVRDSLRDPTCRVPPTSRQAILDVLQTRANALVRPEMQAVMCTLTISEIQTLVWGTMLMHHNHPKEALRRYDHFLQIHPQNATVLTLKRKLSELSLMKTGVIAPRESFFATPTTQANEESYAGMLAQILSCGSLLAYQNRHQEAIARYDLYLNRFPNCLIIQGMKGVALYALKDYTTALSICDDIIQKQGGDNPVLLYGRGVVRVALHRYEEAEIDYRKALNLLPTDPSILSNLGAALLLQHKSQEGLDMCNVSLTIRPDHVHTLNNRAVAFKQLNQLQAAIDTYQHILTIDPHYLKAIENLGILHQYLGKDDEANRYYDEHLTLMRKQ